ncbi:MAG: hypothetical protein WAL71_18735 [Terriglobales bacterium]
MIDYSQLLKRLERYRKRAKRLWIKTGSAEAYREYHARRGRFLEAVHTKVPRRRDVVRAHYQKRASEILEITKPLLAAQPPCWVPLDDDLQPIVRAAIRHVRRERAPVTFKDLICATPDGKSFLSGYVGKRVRILFWQRVHELEAKEARSPEENDDASAAVRELARDKAREVMIRRNLYPAL